MTDSGAVKPSGFLVLNKPRGVSSAKALNAVKRKLPRGTKVGHAGTLDPFATGVLVVLVGRATKQCERIMRLPKGYEATLRLGATTATLDPESPEIPFTPGGAASSSGGDAVRRAPAQGAPSAALSGAPTTSAPSRQQVEHVLARFVGTIQQLPPDFSALKVAGRRAYDLARAGRDFQLVPRTVSVCRLELLEYKWPDLQVFVECGRGFYVRSLARDVGEALGTGAYLKALRRTFVGPFAEALAADMDAEAPNLLLLEWLDHRMADDGL